VRFSAESVARGKPHPDLFLHAAAAMGACAGASVVVEVTPTGVLAGVAAGMRVLGHAADSDAAALEAAGAEIVPSMAEVPERIGLG
jgi:beta-phosphoglucomutase-like phosphatase (HAD superfamily)